MVKYGDGRLAPVPVMYGDMDRQVANILKDNSENKVNGPPRIAIYVSSLEMEKERLADPTYVGKIHLRERSIENGEYTSSQGSNYTVERLMPTPYKLTIKADIWAGSTEQKLQILEQILMLFNPSLDIQTTDNYIDWTSLSVVYLDDVQFSSRTIPVGQDSPIDIATLTFSMPIWISPPSKVKKLGVVSKIVMSMFTNIGSPAPGYIDGLGTDPNAGVKELYDEIPSPIEIDIIDLPLIIIGGKGRIPIISNDKDSQEESYVSWLKILEKLPNSYTPGESKIFLKQSNGLDVIGSIAIDPIDSTILNINWDKDTYPNNTDIESQNRPNSPGTFDAIIDPQVKGPGAGLPAPYVGLRYLIINNIGGGIRETLIAFNNSNRIDTNVEFSKVLNVKVFVNYIPVEFISHNIEGKFVIQLKNDAVVDDIITYILYTNATGPTIWQSIDGQDFLANANDIIEWDGTKWNIIFDSMKEKDSIFYLTDIHNGVQFKWDGIGWSKSFEGEYRKGSWRLIL